MSDVRVGVIGAGFGRRVQIPAIRLVPGARVTAISSGRFETAAEAARECGGGAQAFRSGEEVARSPEVDVVLVSSPPDTHRQYALAALAAGKHVVCEKPMALAVAQAEEMVRAAEAHPDQLALVDHELRYEPNRRRVRELIRSGAIGQVRHIELQLKPYLRGDGRPQAFTAPWSWWSERSRFGGIWGAVGSHLVDLCRYWLGEEPSRVIGTVQTFIKERPDPSGAGMKPVTSDDYVHAVLEFPSGARATLSLSAVAHHGRGHRGEVTGSEGTIVVEGEHQLFLGRPGGELEEITVPDPHWGKTTPNSMWARSFLKLMEDVVGRVTEQGAGSREQELIAATFEDGLAIQRVLDAVGGPRD